MVSLLCWLVRHVPLSRKDRTKALNTLVLTAGGLPLHASITTDGGQFSIRGVPLQGEYAVKIRESAAAAIHNTALQAVDEQTLYLAVSHGIHVAQDFDQTLFAKAAVWLVEQRRNLLSQLAQEHQQLDA